MKVFSTLKAEIPHPLIGFFAQSIYLRAKGQLIINHGAQIFIMLHLLNSRVIDQERGRDCGASPEINIHLLRLGNIYV